ncbi:MAG: polymerase sigma-70 factor, subfamily [Candidatus Poribacteria bacterium]|nr:polymerase sigma-70 factor, subfamily [Candidatus Poribacteria bacterium]
MQKQQNTCVLSGYSIGIVNMPVDIGTSKIERFESIAVVYIDSIYSFALYMTENECDAQDLVQYTYIKAYKHFDDLEDETNYKAWLLKISVDAFMKSIPHGNMPANVSHTSNNEEFMNHISDEKTFKEETSEKDIKDDVTMAIQSLPIKYRMIVILADIEKFSNSEISYILNCPMGTVTSKLHEGRQMLKEKLQIYSDRYGYQENQSCEKEVSSCEQ